MSLRVAARERNLNQLVDKCIAEADILLHFCPLLCQEMPSLHSQHQTAYCCAVYPYVCNNHSKCAEKKLVLQIFCTHSEPNFSLPWQRKRQYSSTSSGFITDAKRILTNAHCVDHHTQARHCFQPSCLSRGTASSVHAAFRLVSRHDLFIAFSLHACLEAQLLHMLTAMLLSPAASPD